jgi:hypothetical protein
MHIAVIEHGAAPGWGRRVMIDAPLALYESTAPADWVDYNGHMTESSYLLLVGKAADAFFPVHSDTSLALDAPRAGHLRWR